MAQLFNIEKKINLKRRKLMAKGKTGVESRAIATNVLETIISSGGNVEACLKEARVLHKKRFLGEKRIDRFVKTVLRLIEKKGHLNNQFARKLNAEFRKSGVTGIGEDKGAPDGDDKGGGSGKKDEENGEPTSPRGSPLPTALDSILRVCKENKKSRKWEQSNVLIARAQDGDNNARNEAVLANMGLVVKVAKRYIRGGVPLEDLIGYGVEGLIRAIEKFDLKNGAQISTFAPYHIRAVIQRSIINREYTIRLPIHKVNEIAKERKAARDKGESQGGERSNLYQLTQVSSLNEKMGGREDGDEFIDFIPSGNPSPEESVMILQRVKRNGEMVALLKSRLSVTQYFVLERRFGLSNGEGASLEDIGQELSLTRERVRQIEQSAFKKARKILKDFYSAGLH